MEIELLNYINLMNKDIEDGEELNNTKQLSLYDFHIWLEAEIHKDNYTEYKMLERTCKC
jgi:hypothetical protein